MQEKMAFLRCPAQLCDFRSENLASYLERMCKLTESRLFFFKTSYGRFCIFWDRYFGRISRTAKKRTSFQFVGWCMINIVSNNHTQIRKIERGMVNLPPWQWLDWPSPHIYLYILSYTGQAPRALRRLYDGTQTKGIVRGLRGTHGRRAPAEEGDVWGDARGEG